MIMLLSLRLWRQGINLLFEHLMKKISLKRFISFREVSSRCSLLYLPINNIYNVTVNDINQTDFLQQQKMNWIVTHNSVQSVGIEWFLQENFLVIICFICEYYCTWYSVHISVRSGCLRSWLYHDNSCPLCRSPIPLTPTQRNSHDPSEASTRAGGLNESTTRHTPFQIRNRRNITKFVCVTYVNHYHNYYGT